jgi:hypothetical protein
VTISRRAAAILALSAALGAVGVVADVAPTPDWRLTGSVSTALINAQTIYLGGSFTQLSTPATGQDQFLDPITAQPRTQCARSTSPANGLTGVPDGRGGLLVVVQPDDAFADVNGPFAPPPGTTIVRIGVDCLWDRGFAAPSIDPAAPGDLTIGIPVPVGGRILAANAVIGPDLFLRAQVAAFDSVSGARVGFQYYQGVAEIGFYGPGPTQAIARVIGTDEAEFHLGAVDPSTLVLTRSPTLLADEGPDPSATWLRGPTMFRARPAPENTLEAYDLATLAERSGWTKPAVPTLADLEVVGSRVFVAAPTVNGQAVPQPAALALDTGAVETAWAPPVLAKRVPDPSGTPYVATLTAIATDGQRLYVSGDFERAAGTDRDGVMAITLATAALDPWDPTPLVVQPLEFTAGGLLTTRPGSGPRVTRRFLAAVNRATGAVTAWNPNDSGIVLKHVASPVSALATDGRFLYFASATRGEVLRADLGTAVVDENWRFAVTRAGGQPGSIVAMVIHNDVIYLGGDFTSIAGLSIAPTPRRALAAVDLGGVLRSWAPALDAPEGSTLIRRILPLGPTIYLGGDFTSVNGSLRLGFAAVDGATGELVQPELFTLGGTRIHGLATDGLQIFVTGVSFGAPLVGSASIPGSVLAPYGPTGGVVPSSAAFVAARLYAGREYDPDAAGPTARTTDWGEVFADGSGLLNLPAGGGVEYYAAVPGNPPGAPTLTSSVTGNTVRLAWTADPAGGTPSNYTIYAGSLPGLYNLGAINVGTASFFTATIPNGRYYAAVVARNGFGPGPPSNEVVLQVGPPPCTVAPTAPGPLTFTTAANVVSLTWGASPTASGYVIEAGSVPGAADVGGFPVSNVTSVAVSAPRGTYYVRLRATSSCGVSPPSNEVAIVVDGGVPLPQAPTGLTATVVGRAVAIGWTPPTAGGTPAGYLLEAGYAPGAANAAVIPTTVPALGAAGVPPATYYVRVRAFNAAGAGPVSAEITLIVP